MFIATGNKRHRGSEAPTRTPLGTIIDLTSDGDQAPEPKRAKSGTPSISTSRSVPPRLDPHTRPPQYFQQSTYFGVTQTNSTTNKPATSSRTSTSGVGDASDKSIKSKLQFRGTLTRQQHRPINAGNASHYSSTRIASDRTTPLSASSISAPAHAPPISQSTTQVEKRHAKVVESVQDPKIFHVPKVQPLVFSPVGSEYNNGVGKDEATKLQITHKSHNTKAESFKLESPKPLKFDVHQPLRRAEERHTLPNGPQSDKERSRPPRMSSPTVDIPKLNTPWGTPGSIHNTIPIRQSPTPSSFHQASTPSARLSQLSQTIVVSIPSPKKSIVISIPPSEEKRRRREMVERLKQNTNLAKTNPDEIEKILGQFGFSAVYTTTLDETRLIKVASEKQRQVIRAKIELDLGQKRRKKSKDLATSMQNLSLIHPQEQVKAILTDRFGEKHDPPITFSNDINDNRLNGKFQFVSKYIFRKGVKLSGHLAKPSCNCNGPCQIDTCTCLKRLIKDSHGQRHLQMEFYERRPDGLLVLTSDYITRYDTEVESRVEISECNETCSCPPTCPNRVVQKGRTVPLDIFQTPRCGFGVRSPHDLVKGQFIELYLGEVITESELRRRESAQEEHETSYIYSLDWFETHSPNSVCHVDGANFGSAMRFVNHSCNPNARPFTVLNSRSTKQIHDVAFFAIRDIPAGTEITIDYSPQMQGEIHEVIDDEDVVACLCGSPNCRGKLWRPGQERRVSKKKLRGLGD